MYTTLEKKYIHSQEKFCPRVRNEKLEMKKKLMLKKETLIKLQEKQMQALIGAQGISNHGNTLNTIQTIHTIQPVDTLHKPTDFPTEDSWKILVVRDRVMAKK